MATIDRLLELAVHREASDLHLIAGQPARIRRHGELLRVGNERLGREALEQHLLELMPEAAAEQLWRHDSADFAYTVASLGRFRVNAFHHMGGMGAVFRAIPSAPQAMEALGLPRVLSTFCRGRQGLILVTGKTGSGKSTTLAAMIDFINRSRRDHVITVEDPIEHVHHREQCLISQRELGQHTSGFAPALRSALREDPDVILVGELRDSETMGLAVTAAEMGILVFGTLHTATAVTAVDRVVNAFPAKKQGHVRAMLSTSLRAVIAQQLLRRADSDGRVAAVEVLINTPAVANLLREGKTDQLQTAIQGGALVGMQSMDNALRGLLDQGLIDGREAYRAASNKKEFESYARG